MPKVLPYEGFMYSLPPDDDSIKRWSFVLGGVRYIGHGNNVVPPAGMHGARWSRQLSGLLAPNDQPDKCTLEEILEELHKFQGIKGLRFPIRVKPPPKTHVKYVSGLKEAAKAHTIRHNLLEGICKHGTVFPFCVRPKKKTPIPPCLVEDEPTVRALAFDYQVDGPEGEW